MASEQHGDGVERDDKGLFKGQGPSDGFDPKSGVKSAQEHAWNNRREQILKNRYPNLWEEVKDE